MPQVTTSKQFRLNVPDWVKAFIVAAISPVVPILLSSLNAGTFTVNWKEVGTTALAAGIAYLAKNFFSPTQTTITGDVDVKITPPTDAATKK